MFIKCRKCLMFVYILYIPAYLKWCIDIYIIVIIYYIKQIMFNTFWYMCIVYINCGIICFDEIDDCLRIYLVYKILL